MDNQSELQNKLKFRTYLHRDIDDGLGYLYLNQQLQEYFMRYGWDDWAENIAEKHILPHIQLYHVGENII